MKCKPEELANHLEKNAHPIVWINGDEPFLVQHSADKVRQYAKKNGFERMIVHGEPRFNWDTLLTCARNRSLFSKKQLIELRLYDAKIAGGSDALLEYVKHCTQDTLLLITSSKLESATQKTKWFQTFEKNTLMVAIWPIDRTQFPTWIAHNAQQKSLALNPQSIALLSHCFEGHLLACESALAKLQLLYSGEPITLEMVEECVSDNSRHDIYQLADSCLEGQLARTLKILTNLKNEGVEPTLILWALVRDLRVLAALSWCKTHLKPPDEVMQAHKVFNRRQSLMLQASKRYSYQQWQNLLLQAGAIDQIIKGASQGNLWDAFSHLCLRMNGVHR